MYVRLLLLLPFFSHFIAYSYVGPKNMGGRGLNILLINGYNDDDDDDITIIIKRK